MCNATVKIKEVKVGYLNVFFVKASKPKLSALLYSPKGHGFCQGLLLSLFIEKDVCYSIAFEYCFYLFFFALYLY